MSFGSYPTSFVYHIQFFVRHESSSRFWRPKTFDEEKECVINSVLKSMVYENELALQIFREWQDQRALKICSIKPGRLFKGEDIGVDKQV